MKKITDKVLDRTLDIAVVMKPAANAVFGGGNDWTRPMFYEVKNSDDIFVRVPHGPFALRVMSKHAVDLLVHIDGVLRKRVSLPKGISYVETDGDNQPLLFLEKGAVAPAPLPRTDAEAAALLQPKSEEAEAVDIELPGIQNALALSDSEGVNASGASVQQPLAPPTGHNVVHIVARFAHDSQPGLKPPQQEYETIFVLNTPADHDELLAGNLLHMEPPPASINLDDELDFEPSQKHRPSFVCTCTGCRTGGSLLNY